MRIRVVGAYLPQLDPAGMEKFIADDADSFRRTLRELRDRGVVEATDVDIEVRARQLPAEVKAGLETCALFELEVTGNAGAFDAGDFENPDTGQCAWEPAFLSLDGASLLATGRSAPGKLKDFRVAFYVHLWDAAGRLCGPMGVLQLPHFLPVPDRLWRLAPYRPVD